MCSQFLGALTRWAVVYFEKPDSKQMLISQVLVAAGLRIRYFVMIGGLVLFASLGNICIAHRQSINTF